MDAIVKPVADWWNWTLATAYSFEPYYLLIMLIACLVTALTLAFQLKQFGFLGKSLVTVIGAASLMALCLALTHVDPVFFSPEDLARSQSIR